MASLSIDPNGNGTIHVTTIDGRRFPIRLGKVGRQRADRVRDHIAELESARRSGVEPTAATRAWLVDVTGPLRARLVRAGLAEASAEAVTADKFIGDYIAERVDLKDSTKLVCEQARVWLTRFIGKDKLMRSVTVADADAYKAHSIKRGLSRATIAKRCKLARHYFDVAKRRGLVDDNPFSHIPGSAPANLERRVFVPGEVVQRVMDQAPDPQWKLLIALARWGGLRVPSEPLALTWADVDFAGRKFIVRSSKTKHHDGGGVRIVPMFSEMAELFQQVFDEAQPGEVFVITRYRNPAANLRTQLVRYIEAAGLTAWVKPWQNMRASRATELADKFPSHVCAKWLGHSETIADAHYRTVTDEHFRRAISDPGTGPKSDSEKAVRKAVRAGSAIQSNGDSEPRFHGNKGQCSASKNMELAPTGFEPVTFAV